VILTFEVETAMPLAMLKRQAGSAIHDDCNDDNHDAGCVTVIQVQANVIQPKRAKAKRKVRS
jgi:hypothetical protein